MRVLILLMLLVACSDQIETGTSTGKRPFQIAAGGTNTTPIPNASQQDAARRSIERLLAKKQCQEAYRQAERGNSNELRRLVRERCKTLYND